MNCILFVLNLNQLIEKQMEKQNRFTGHAYGPFASFEEQEEQLINIKMSSSQLRVAQVQSHESQPARQIMSQDRAAPVSHSQSKGRNILSKLQDQETQPVPMPVYSDQTTFKASKKPAKIARQVKQQISNRLGKLPEAEFELARRPVLEGPNFSAALVNLLQSNQNSFSVTFSGNQQFATVDPTIATQVHQNKTTPAEQLASNISNIKNSSINDTTRPIRSIKRKSHQEPPATGRPAFDNQYGTLPHQVLPAQPIKKSCNSTMRSGIDRQLETRATYGRKSSSNKRNQINQAIYRNSFGPAFEQLPNASYGQLFDTSNASGGATGIGGASGSIAGRIQISRDKSNQRLQNEIIIDSNPKTQSQQLRSGQQLPQNQNVQFNNYCAKGPTEAYTQNNSVLTPQSIQYTTDSQPREGKKPPITQRPRKQNNAGNISMITSDPDTLLFEGTKGRQQHSVGIESQLRDLPIAPVLATNDQQVPSRLESLIKQLIVGRQMSTSPNVVIQRLNESEIIAAPSNTFDASLKMLNEHENDRYNQQDVLSTFTAHPKDKHASGTTTNIQTKKIKFQSIQHKPSEGNLVNPVIMQSQLCQQRSPTNQFKIGELPGEHNLSKEIEMESLLNYQELLNSKDILGSSLPISQTLHLALSNAMRGNDQSAQNSKLRPNSQVDHASFEAGASPQKQLSMQEKYDAKLLTNLNKNQQNFISLDLQPKSVGSEDIYEQTLMAFQNDLNQLHEIEQSRQEISDRIREHQRVLNRIHNVQTHNRGSFVLPQSNRQASNRQAIHTANTQQASLDIACTNMSQIDFAHLQRMTQNSVEPNFYDQRSQFIPSHLQQHYANQNDTQHSLDPKTQNASIGDGQKITTSPTIGRYRLKGFHGAAYQPISNVYSNRNPSGVVQDKKTKSVRQRISRHLQPLANTSVGGGSNLRSVGRKFVLTQMNSGTKGYGTIEPPKKTQTGYIPLSSGLASIDQATKNQVAALKNKSTTIVYGPQAYSTIGSSNNRRSSVPKQRQQFSNLRPTLQLKNSKAIRSFSNRNRVIQQSLIQQNTSQNVARNTYASIGSGSLNSQNGYHYGLQNSSIENTKTTSTNALESFLPEDRSISPHNLKSKTQAKPTARGEFGQPRKVYKKSVSRGRGEGGVANSSFVPGIRKDSQISKGMHPNQLPKAAQMSHQHVVIRDSLQNETANSSIVRVNNNISMRMSPNDKIFQTQAAYDNKANQVSPEKLKIQQLQKKLQLSEQNGIRQVRIRGNITRNYFSNDADAYQSDPMYTTHDITGQHDFSVGGQVIVSANNNANEKKNNLRYSRATYDFANGNMFDEEQVTSQEKQIPAQESEGRIKEEGGTQQRMMEIINEDNPFENPVTRSVGYLNQSTAVQKQVPTIQQAIKKARFTGQQWARISPFGQNSTPQNQTPQTANAILPMKQHINHVIKEEEATAEQDEKTTIKESSRRDKKDSTSLDSVEDECMIGESNSPSQLKVIEQKFNKELMDDAEFSRAWEDQDVSKPVRGLNNFNQRVIARGSIKFGSSSQTQHIASLKVLPQKEPSVNTSNLFGVNLLEQQRLQQTSPKRSEPSSDSPITASDGNLICESVRNPIDDSNCIVPHITQSPLHKADLGPAERDIINQSNLNDVTNSRLFNTRLSNMVDQLELTDFPPLLKTQTNYQQSARSEAQHSDDEVSVRRALEESENCVKSDFEQNPQLQRQSTHSLLKKHEASKVYEDSEIDLEDLKHNKLRDDFRDEGCETPNDLQLDQDDAQPESTDDYLRGPPKNNNFIGRPTTAHFAGQRQQRKDSI